jgi:hypothetical protein
VKVQGFRSKVQGFLLAVLVMAALPSCFSVTNVNGHVAWGGKGAARGNGWAVVYDNEQSFRDGAVLAGAAASSGFSYLADKAAEGTAQVINANAARQAINASNNAAAVATEEIKAGVIKATVLPK